MLAKAGNYILNTIIVLALVAISLKITFSTIIPILEW